jgi:hypothetical protein
MQFDIGQSEKSYLDSLGFFSIVALICMRCNVWYHLCYTTIGSVM